MQRSGSLVNLNVHFHLLVPDGVFVDDDDRLAFALHPVPTSADVLAILDRIARRLADEARDDRVEEPPASRVYMMATSPRRASMDTCAC